MNTQYHTALQTLDMVREEHRTNKTSCDFPVVLNLERPKQTTTHFFTHNTVRQTLKGRHRTSNGDVC